MKNYVILMLIFMCNINFVHADGEGKIPLPVTTYNQAQVVEWLNNDVFAVGRWDGSISLFREPQDGEYGPVIMQALISPSSKPIEMLQRIDDNTLISSNDDKTMVVWEIDNGILKQNKVVKYEQSLGVMNSSMGLNVDGKMWMVAGHANGFVSIWHYTEGEFFYNKSVNVRSESAPANPYGLYNIRSVVHYKDDIVILASEDGDITLFQVTTGKVLLRKRYNEKARRGINSVYYSAGYLLLANCSLGKNDKKLWLYRIKDTAIDFVSSRNLIKDKSRDQVFNFDVEMTTKNNKLYFYAGTEEGLLWVGYITNDKIEVFDSVKVSFKWSASLDIDPDNNKIVAASHAIKLFPLLR